MNERKSKVALANSMYVQKVTALLVVVVAITCMYFDSWMSEQTQLFINNFYFVKQNSQKVSEIDFDSLVQVQSSGDNKYFRIF